MPNPQFHYSGLLRTCAFAACIVSTARAGKEMEPNASVLGTRGLGGILSAEAMGHGRLTVHGKGNLYQMGRTFPGAPAKGSQVSTSTLAVAYGINPFFDAFLGLAAYNVAGSKTPGQDDGGLGTVSGGVQAGIPFSE